LSRLKLFLPSWAESAMTHLIKESDTIVKSELLFYIQNKIKTTNKESIVAFCSSFYSESEILKEKTVFFECVGGKSTTRRGDNATANNLIDIIDKMLSLDSSGTEFPTFSATDLTRVPHIVEEQEGVATIEQLLASLSEMKKSMASYQKSMVSRDLLCDSLRNLKDEIIASCVLSYMKRARSGTVASNPPSHDPDMQLGPAPHVDSPTSPSLFSQSSPRILGEPCPSTSAPTLLVAVAPHVSCDTTSIKTVATPQLTELSSNDTSFQIPVSGANLDRNKISSWNKMVDPKRVNPNQKRGAPSNRRDNSKTRTIIGKKVSGGLLSF
jgi:hypothetical protein